jgi:hypothetical protein
MLSPSSGAEVTRQGSRRVFIGPEHQELWAGSQSEGGNMGTGCRPLGSLQEGYREGVEHGVRKKRDREIKPFSGLTRGRHVLVRASLYYRRLQFGLCI